MTVRTTAVGEAVAALKRAGAEVMTADTGALTVSGLTAEKIVAVLTGETVVFSEVSAHRASLEEAYLELTRDVVDYRAEPVRGAA